jgi:NAD(P)-dependent dehydrogenase (short-subunit alcohol dehydrogenase family)
MGKLDGKIALVTGSSRGIGRGIAEAFAAEGAQLALAARSGPALDEVAQGCRRYGVDVLAVATDVTQEVEIVELFQRCLDHFARLDVLVNNAGAFDGGPLDELSTEAWDWVMAVNLRAPFICTREAMRIMKRQQGGRIINIGSISAQRVRPNSGPYSASKHGMWGLSQVTALEGREHNITCCCLHPGNVRVERRESDRPEDQEPMMATQDIAQVAVTRAALPPHVEMLEAIVLPHKQAYVGRG